MELDEMKALWAAHDVKIEQSLRLNRRLLAAIQLNRARSSMQWLIVGLVLEAGIQFIAILAVGSFLYAYWGNPRFEIPGLLVDIFAIGIFSSLIRQIVMASQIDYSAAVTAIQRRIEDLRILRIRTVQGILSLSPLLWTPLLIVCLKGLLGFDAYQHLSLLWLGANTLFGIAFAVGVAWAARSYADQLGSSPLIQRLARDLAGHSLNSATRFVASIDDLSRAEG
jgi:hypothetical protein